MATNCYTLVNSLSEMDSDYMKILTTKQIAAILSVSVRQIQREIKLGYIKVDKITDGAYRVKDGELENYEHRPRGARSKRIKK